MLGPLATSCVKDYKGHSFVQTSFIKLPSRNRKNSWKLVLGNKYSDSQISTLLFSVMLPSQRNSYGWKRFNKHSRRAKTKPPTLSTSVTGDGAADVYGGPSSGWTGGDVGRDVDDWPSPSVISEGAPKRTRCGFCSRDSSRGFWCDDGNCSSARVTCESASWVHRGASSGRTGTNVWSDVDHCSGASVTCEGASRLHCGACTRWTGGCLSCDCHRGGGCCCGGWFLRVASRTLAAGVSRVLFHRAHGGQEVVGHAPAQSNTLSHVRQANSSLLNARCCAYTWPSREGCEPCSAQLQSGLSAAQIYCTSCLDHTAVVCKYSRHMEHLER